MEGSARNALKEFLILSCVCVYIIYYMFQCAFSWKKWYKKIKYWQKITLFEKIMRFFLLNNGWFTLAFEMWEFIRVYIYVVQFFTCFYDEILYSDFS